MVKNQPNKQMKGAHADGSQLDRFKLDFEYDKTTDMIRRDIKARTGNL